MYGKFQTGVFLQALPLLGEHGKVITTIWSWAYKVPPGNARVRNAKLKQRCSLFRVFLLLLFNHLNVIYQYALQHIEALLPPFSATSAAFVCLRNHVVDFLRNVALHDDFIYASCVLRH